MMSIEKFAEDDTIEEICIEYYGSGKIRVFRSDWEDNDEIDCDECCKKIIEENSSSFMNQYTFLNRLNFLLPFNSFYIKIP